MCLAKRTVCYNSIISPCSGHVCFFSLLHERSVKHISTVVSSRFTINTPPYIPYAIHSSTLLLYTFLYTFTTNPCECNTVSVCIELYLTSFFNASARQIPFWRDRCTFSKETITPYVHISLIVHALDELHVNDTRLTLQKIKNTVISNDIPFETVPPKR